MARNADIVLTPAQRANVASRTRQLRPLIGATAQVEYVKRDGSESATLSGTVESVTCNGDHGTVTMVTDKGYRSANLHTVTRVVAL